MKAILVDNEKYVLDLMRIVIGKNSHIEIIGEFTEASEALKEVERTLPDVVFIDIEMPHINGIEFAKHVEDIGRDIQIVFVTAYGNYALDAFKVNAVNYILKPITEEDVNMTVERLLKNIPREKQTIETNKLCRIDCLGNFKVYGRSGEEIIKWSTSKVKEMFAYFVYRNGERIDKWNLCDMLWEDSSPKKAEHNLHSSVYRLRTVFKSQGIENIINYQSGKYKIDFSEFTCDLWEFQDFIYDNLIVNDENINDYTKMLRQYKGALFGSEDYSWTMDLNEKISRSYSYGLKSIAKYYIEKEKYNESHEYLTKAIKENPFDEEAHDLILNVYFYLGDRVGLISHYNKLVKLFNEELHIPIKDSTNRLYDNILSKL